MIPKSCRLFGREHFSGKVESGFPSENASNAKMPERFLFPVSVKPLPEQNQDSI
jgi:hypothetical protein